MMIQDTLLSKSLQLSQWVLQSQLENLESELEGGWNSNTSQHIDACLELEAAIDRFQGYLAPIRPPRYSQSVCAHQIQFARPPRRVLPDDPHGFESVGSIMRRDLKLAAIVPAGIEGGRR